MPANKSASIRYRIIDQCLRSKGAPFPGKEDIQEEMQERIGYVSMSTIDKDLYAMRFDEELGFLAPIKYSKLHKGYHYEDPDFSIEKIPLSANDLENLELAMHTLDQFRDVPMFKEVDQAIGKIVNLMKLNRVDSQKDKQDYISFESMPRAQGAEWLEVIYQSILERKVIELEYRPFQKNESKIYSLNPYLLKEYRARWYLLAFSPERDAVLTFGLDRVLSIKVQKEEFRRSSKFDSKEFFKHSFGITVSHETKVEKVKLKVGKVATDYLKSQPLHSTQKIISESEDGMQLEIQILPSYEFYSQIMSWGDQIQIISPEAIRSRMKEWIKRGLEAYSKSS